ncbi:MAG: ABC transporter substrate-binding protein [Hoeflea sp.]|uniref:ABC transporter substrate-binding protein n=1 Tax=Hoeflea sp. TaxID=1940281 RepID=UPI003EF5B518
MITKPPRFRLPLVLALFLAAAPALAEPLHVGLVIPQSGQFKPLGDHVREAFRTWDAANPNQFEDIVEGDDSCSEQSGTDAAAAMIEAGVNVVVGFLCTESLAAALPSLSDENIPVITLTVRADIIGEEAARLGWKFFRLAPRAGSEAEIASDAIFKLWADKSFALIEDGAISGRELAESIRIKLENRGLKPNFVDNYRPGQATQPSLIRRLKSAGVARVFVGGERSDLAVIAMEAARQGVDLEFMGGDALHAPQGELPIPDGTIAVLAADSTPGPEAEAARIALEDAGFFAEGLRIPAYAAAEILGTVATRMQFSDTDLEEALRTTTFSTALGPVTFDHDGERREPGFVLAILQDGEFSRLSVEEAARIAGDRR